jgi:hypothetical protein
MVFPFLKYSVSVFALVLLNISIQAQAQAQGGAGKVNSGTPATSNLALAPGKVIIKPTTPGQANTGQTSNGQTNSGTTPSTQPTQPVGVPNGITPTTPAVLPGLNPATIPPNGMTLDSQGNPIQQPLLPGQNPLKTKPELPPGTVPPTATTGLPAPVAPQPAAPSSKPNIGDILSAIGKAAGGAAGGGGSGGSGSGGGGGNGGGASQYGATASGPAQACSVSTQCNNAPTSGISVNLSARCMCIDGKDCFLISIGSAGPNMTTSGSGTMGSANGAKYQTKSGPGVASYDNDALSMGIGPNDSVGKWIHKTRNCSPGGSASTLGCIAVPCDKWLAVKAQKGKALSVCGSGALGGRGAGAAGGDRPSGGSSGRRGVGQ